MPDNSFDLRSKRKLITHRKFYFFDAGVYRKIKPKGPLDSENEMLGAVVETLILQEIIARNEYQNWNYKIHFWRTQKHNEVDFIFSSPNGARFVLFGGEKLPEPTVIYWNFITDTMGEAKQALIDWEEGKFPEVRKYSKIQVGKD